MRHLRMLLAVTVLLQAQVYAQAFAQAPLNPDALRGEAYEAAQWAQQTSAGNALAQLGARFAASGGPLGELVRLRQDQIERWKSLDKQIFDVMSQSDEPSRARAAKLRTDQGSVNTALVQIDEKLAKDFPAYAELSTPKPVSEKDTQALLDKDEALILIYNGKYEAYVWAITTESASWTKVEQSETVVEQKIKLLRETLDPTGRTRAAVSSFGEDVQSGSAEGEAMQKAFPRAEANQLYQWFLQPLEGIWKSKKRLNIVVSGALSSLPFSVLISEPPNGEDTDERAMRGSAWLIRTHALVTLPAVSSLRALRKFGVKESGNDKFQGFGAPKLGSSGDARGGKVRSAAAYFRGTYANVDAVRQLASLPETEGELKLLAKELGADATSVTTGEFATEGAVKKADLSKTRVIAFATHGLIAGDLQGLAEPALVFTPPAVGSAEDDGLLTATEAAQLKLSADWVILSACNTASGDGKPGAEGLSGLARAFFYAGARALLVSHWPVLDIAAAKLTTQTLRELQESPEIGRAEALRRSMVKMIDDDSNPVFAQPMAWAPFVVVGEGR